MQRLFLAAVVVYFLASGAFGRTTPTIAPSIMVDEGKEVPGTFLYYWVDSARTATLASVQNVKKSGLFVQNQTSVFSKPPSMDYYWFYFEVHNQMNEPLWLDVGSIFSWELEVYIQVDDSTFVLHDKRVASKHDGIRTYGHHRHWISLPKTYTYGKRACYVRIQSAGPVEFPLTIGSLADLYRLKARNDWIVASFIAITLLMIFYNGILLVFTKDTLYGYYIFYLVMIAPAVLFGNGFPLFEYVFGVSTFWKLHVFVWFFPAFLSIGLFTTKYLELNNRASRLFILVWVGVAILALLACLNLFIHPVKLSLLYVIGLIWLMFSCLGSGIYLYIKGYDQARLYVLGWSVLFLSLGVYMLTLYGYFPYNMFTRNITYYSVSLEFILFSLALADRMQHIRRQHEQMKDQLLQKTQEHATLVNAYNEELQREVHHKTLSLYEKASSLEEANQEVTSINEELKSLIDELQHVLQTVHDQNKTIQSQSDHIQAINAGLEAAILEKTGILTEQNERLKAYAYINSHKVRAPLARILGLTTLIKAEKERKLVDAYFTMLSDSAKELDVIIREMNTILVEAGYFTENH